VQAEPVGNGWLVADPETGRRVLLTEAQFFHQQLLERLDAIEAKLDAVLAAAAETRR
jgi:hypothetical protein